MAEATRSLTLLVVAANDPAQLDAMDFATRRQRPSTRIELRHRGAPDVLVRRALELDPGVYQAPRVWDDDAGELVETSLLTRDALQPAIAALARQLDDPRVVADRLVRGAGTDEDRARVARALVEELPTPAAGPAEEAATYVRVLRAHAPAAIDDAMGLAWEYRTRAPCACAVWDGLTPGDLRAFPRSQFVTLAREAADATRSVGRLRCTHCRATFAFVATATSAQVTREPPRDTIELGADEIDRVIAGIRDGARVMLGSGRCHTTCFGRDGELFVEDFDEGASTERPCAAAELRVTIASRPAEFLEVLRRPLREVLRHALVGNPTVSPHEAIRDLLAWGECLDRRHLLAAVIDWPTELGPAARAELATIHDGNDGYHFVRAAVGYETSTPGTGRFGLQVFAALEAMLGRELPRWRRYRADFRVMVGDAPGGIADLERELASLPADDVDRPYLTRELARLADARLLAEIAANPADDAPRLVWADMLTERGDPRGEMIVALCRTASLDEDDPERESLLVRVKQLLALHGRTWGKKGYTYWRGIVHGVEVRWPTYAENFDEAFALSPPIQELRFRTYKDERMDDPARALADPRLEQLAELEVSSPRFEVGGEVIRFESQVVRRLAGRLPNLRKLAIRDAQLTLDEARAIGPRRQLEALDLGQVPLRGALAALFGAGGFDALRDLTLDHCGLDDDDVTVLAKLPALTKLEVGGNAFGARGALALASLGLQRLRMEGNVIGDEGASSLAAYFKGRTLNVAGAGIGNPGAAALADLELSSLALGNNAYDVTAARAIARGRAGKTLQRLVLGPCGDRPLSGEIVHALAGMPRLWQLLLRGCAIDADGAVALLEGLPRLRVLTLGHCAIDDAGLAKIVAHPAFAQIDTLELDHNALGPDAGAILARCPQLPRTLFLNNNHLGDAGARALAEAPVASRVVDLLLLNNGITDEGARALVGESSQLVGAISRLCLHDNAIGADAAELCREKLGPRFCYPLAP